MPRPSQPGRRYTAGSRPSHSGSAHGSRLVAGLVALHAAEVVVLVAAAAATARAAPSHPGPVAALPVVLVIAAVLAVGWQGVRVSRGRVRLSVAGLVIQSGVLIAAIAVAVANLAAGVIGVVLASAVLALWGRLARPAADNARANDRTGAVEDQIQPVEQVHVDPSSGAPQIAAGGIVLALLTAAVLLAALTVHSRIVVGLAALAVIFIPIERLFALHPRRVLRRGWRTDVVHYLVNGAALNIGLIVVAAVAGTVLRVFVPAALRATVGAAPAWVQIVAGLAITTVGGYAGHRAAHEQPLLWRFHRVHHSIREMDWLAANHLHPLDQTFIRSCSVLPLYALGFGRLGLGAFLTLTTLQAVFIHANVRMTFGPLRWLIATPQFHHWHHAREPRAYNTNYAGEFPALDALFGTLYLPADRWPANYGVDAVEPGGYLRQLAWPLREPCPATTPSPRTTRR